MSEFKVIETQEQFDEAIKARLDRDRKSYAKQFEEDLKAKGWKSPDELEGLTKDLNDKIKTLEDAAAKTAQTLAEKDELIAQGEASTALLTKTRIVLGMGLPIEEADRLVGKDEAEWKADAEAAAKRYQRFAKAQNHPSPLGNPENTGGGTARDQFASWAADTFHY